MRKVNDYAEELFYTKEHDHGQKLKTILHTCGITDFAQSQLGDIIFIEFPNIGDEFKKR